MINIATTRIANPGVILNPEPKFEIKLLETELLSLTVSYEERLPAP